MSLDNNYGHYVSSPASYFTTDGAGTITGLTAEGKAASEIVIPSEINEVAITKIGNYAFLILV